MAQLPCFGWEVMLPATTLLRHHNPVQNSNFIVLFTTQLVIQIVKLREAQKIWKSRVLRENEVDTYGAPAFVLDYSATVLAAKVCTKSNERSMYIRFLWY
jgi:hypothetical protein